MRKIELPSDVRFIISRLASFGHRADVVGGSVRDALLMRPVGDYDLTTSALPEEVRAAFPEFKTVDTGIRHGTLTVIINKVPYEITTYRTDGEYLDNRHPTSVTFTDSLALDLSRRDFTVNAMCYNESFGLTDLFDGERDLSLGVIRAVGEPEVRFTEDALRILRALRFASVLGFSVEERTAAAVRELYPRLKSVSVERIFTEWQKLIAGDGAYSVLRDFGEPLGEMILGIPNILLPAEAAFNAATPALRTYSLYALNFENPAEAFSASMHRLKSPARTRTHGEAVLRAFSGEIPVSDFDILLALGEYGEDVLLDAARLWIMLGRADASLREKILGVSSSGIPYKISALKINGGDLIARGISGERVGAELRRVLLAVMRGECEPTREAELSLLD